MTVEEGNWREFVQGLRHGDEEAYRVLWSEYGEQLRGVAGRRLSAPVQRRVDADDVVQSVCRTFFRRASDGQFVIEDNDSLWRLLCAITVTKSRMHARYHFQQKRNLAHERHFESVRGDGAPAVPETAGEAQAPDEQAALLEEFEKLVVGLDEEERQILDLRLQKYTQQEIADRLECSERTVRRIVKRLQAHLEREFDRLDA